MPKGYAPSVYVSSTCYDLSQVRADIRTFLESLGLEPILSEFNSFPINPESGTIENCTEIVKQRADILVLIIGGRYGSQAPTGKSVTNLEYLQARAKGIPIYVFVFKSILDTLPVWKRNINGDFEGIVDSPKLFEFVESLRDSKEHWVYPFETAQDIIAALRKQLAYLFMDSLILRKQIKGSGLPRSLLNLSGASLQLIIERPLAWEYRLFSQTLSDEMEAAKSIRRDLDYGLNIGKVLQLSEITDISQWLSRKMYEILDLIDAMKKLIDVALPEAVGKPGEPGNSEHIVYVAHRLAEIYRKLIEWTTEFRSVKLDDNFHRLLSLYSSLSKNVIREIEQFTSKLQAELQSALADISQTGKPKRLELTLTLTVPDMSELLAEIDRVRKQYGFSQ